MAFDGVVERLREFDFVHSVILFGSRARGQGKRDSDVDVCVVEVPGVAVSLGDKLRVASALSGDVDVSFFRDLPVGVRHRVFQEGQTLYTLDASYLYSLIKETDFEYPRYREAGRLYSRARAARMKEKAGHG